MIDMRNGICTLCGHNQIVVAHPRDMGANGGSVNLAVTHQFVGVFDKRDEALGVLQICCCRRCGYTQWFTHNPEQLKIGPEHGTQLITGPTTAS